MTEPAKPGRRSAVVAAESVTVTDAPVWVRPPAAVRLEPADLAAETARLAELDRREAEISAEPAGPTPQELARLEAERIVEAARGEADGLRREAREQGYADGLREGHEKGVADGRTEGLAELRAALDRWLAMGDALAEAWRTRFADVEAEVRDVAVAAAERLAQEQLTLAPELVLGVVRDCLRRAAEAELVTVLVSPKDVALVREHRDELAKVLRGTGRFEILEEPKVEPGSCLVETKTQVIDATRATRLKGIADAMEGGA